VTDTIEGLAGAVTDGRLRPPPRRELMPRWLRRVLLRGLSVDPDRRYPSMNELLANLARDPARTIQRSVVGIVAIAMLLVVGLLIYRARDTRPLCKGAERNLVGVWDGKRARAIERAFVATGAPYAADAFSEVRRVLDKFATSWVAMHVAACEATRVRGDQSEGLVGLRIMRRVT